MKIDLTEAQKRAIIDEWLTAKQKRIIVDDWLQETEEEILKELADLHRMKRLNEEKIQRLQSPVLDDIFVDGLGI